jgi:hypothetical protein
MGLFDKLRRARMGDPVEDTAHVVAATRYHGEGIYQDCAVEVVVQADGVEPTAVSKTLIAHRKRWPTPGMTLPITLDRADPTRFTVDWDRVPDRYETAKEASEQLAAMLRGEPGAPAAEPPADDTISRLERLQRLREQGVLTDAEFAEQKHRILGDG